MSDDVKQATSDELANFYVFGHTLHGAGGFREAKVTDLLDDLILSALNATAVGESVIQAEDATDVADAAELGATDDVDFNSVTAVNDVEVTTVGAGFILKSPNGTRYRLAVSDAGVLSASAII